MSAFLVEDKTINTVVKLLKCSDSKLDTTWYFRKLKESGFDLLDGGDFKLGQAMFNLNIKALQERYGPNGEKGYRDLVYKPDFFGTGFTKVQALKSLDCWLYQCSEGNVPEDPLYKLMDSFADSIRRQMVSRMPEYESANWG